MKPYAALALPVLLLAFAPLQAKSTTIEDGVAGMDTVVSTNGFEAGTMQVEVGPRPPVRIPRTPFDTAHRFNMDSGKKLTAAEFDAWLASMGARVVMAEPVVADDPETEDLIDAVALAEASPMPDEAVIEAPVVPQTVKYQVAE
ncbi:MAG TPA: hypothetical protein PKZ76_06830 [Xanthomonadaceae bacterium]|nr:hypothetical protein [Xanthomonadaceae bacterium]